MRADSISAMIADPYIDPTDWVGKALIEWVKKNPLECFSDPVARRYLLQGMETQDLDIFDKGVKQVYQETQDATLVQTFVDAANDVARLARQNRDYNIEWKITTISRTLDEITDQSTIDHVVRLKMPEGDEGYPDKLFKFLRPEHVQELLVNRKPRWGGSGPWCSVVGVMPQETVFEFFTTELYPKYLAGARRNYRNWPEIIQNVMWKVLMCLPQSDAARWYNWLTTTNVYQLYSGDASDLISKSYTESAIYFNEMVCRCGAVTKSKAGHSLHGGSCDKYDSEKASGMNLALASKLFLADSNADSLICRECGKTCKTSSGLSLHSKKCDSELGKNVRRWRRWEMGDYSCAN